MSPTSYRAAPPRIKIILCTHNKPTKIITVVVPRAGLEPAQPQGYRPLKAVCLPIPPPGQNTTTTSCFIFKTNYLASS